MWLESGVCQDGKLHDTGLNISDGSLFSPDGLNHAVGLWHGGAPARVTILMFIAATCFQKVVVQSNM